MDPIYQLILCAKCKDLCLEPYETICCGLLYCKSCFDSAKFYCQDCKKLTQLRKSFVMQKIVNVINMECQYCGLSMESRVLKYHLNDCDMKQIPCKYCQKNVAKKYLISHLAEDHQDFIFNLILNPYTSNKDILVPQKNALGMMAKIGTNGKYYCGNRLDIVCSCCDGFCGPSNGCNCTACQLLDIKTRNLSGAFFVNREGSICKLTALGFYCGRKVLDGVPGCDGYCGPTNGPNCSACNIFKNKFRYVQPLLENLRNK